MKRYFFAFFTIFFFCVMLIFPDTVFLGASKGLLLWFQTVLPTLLPFLILVNIMQKTDLVCQVSGIIHPLSGPLFHISREGSFAVLTGFLCGYPMGAKVTSDLIRDKKITINEGKYLLSFCNNTSPGFVAGFVVCQTIQDPALLLPSMIILFCISIVLSFIFRRIYKIEKKSHNISYKINRKKTVSLAVFDQSIMDSFETITKIGGYIIIFSVLTELAAGFPISHSLAGNLILPFLEITNGVVMLETLPVSFEIRYALIMGLCAFGGLCAAAQTNGMIQGSGLKMIPYIIEKLVAAMATSLLAYLYFQLSGI